MNMNTITLLCLFFTSINHARIYGFETDLTELNEWAESAWPNEIAPQDKYWIKLIGDGYIEFRVVPKSRYDSGYDWRFEIKDGTLREYATCDNAKQPQLIQTRFFLKTNQKTVYHFKFSIRQARNGKRSIKFIIYNDDRPGPAIESEWKKVFVKNYNLEFKEYRNGECQFKVGKFIKSKASMLHSNGAILLIIGVFVFLLS